MSAQPIRIQTQCQNPRQIAVKRQIKRHPLALGRHRRRHDLLDQAPDRLTGFAFLIGFREPRDQRPDPVLPGSGHRRMDPHRGRAGIGGGQFLFQLLLAAGQLFHLRLDPLGRGAGQKGVHQHVLFPDRLRQFFLLHRPVVGQAGDQAVALGDIFLAEDLHQFRVHQPVRQDRQDPALKLLPGDAGAVCAHRFALVARIAAAEAVLADGREAPAAAAAFDKAGQQETRLAPFPRLPLSLGNLAALLARLYPVPEGVIDDAQFRDVRDDPFGFRIVL
ncbi:hypothetical protein SDC9_68229 [bioreactor metagenome]|uniref:Uncharacterized protein n=1 Tax=bioreactor metagenome TaxID=1076179 RepID=A0A644Y6H7_9ZZZZ